MNAPETLTEARRADRISRRRRELEQLLEQRRQCERLIAVSVDGLRRDGQSWAQIGAVLGVSRQAAEQRYRGNKP